MQYIILAAGRGTRLRPLTNKLPKCLFKLGDDITVIERMVSQIKKYDEKAEITIATGFMKEKIEEKLEGVKFVNNPFYEVTNSIASLWFIKESLNQDTILLNGDIVISNSLAEQLFSSKIENTEVLLDSSIKKDGDYNVQVSKEKVIVMSKELENYHGEYVGITLLAKKDTLKFKEKMEEMVEDGYYDQWHENVLVQLIFNENFILKYKDVADEEWTEVDCVNDLIRAKNIHS